MRISLLLFRIFIPTEYAIKAKTIFLRIWISLDKKRRKSIKKHSFPAII